MFLVIRKHNIMTTNTGPLQVGIIKNYLSKRIQRVSSHEPFLLLYLAKQTPDPLDKSH